MGEGSVTDYLCILRWRSTLVWLPRTPRHGRHNRRPADRAFAGSVAVPAAPGAAIPAPPCFRPPLRDRPAVDPEPMCGVLEGEVVGHEGRPVLQGQREELAVRG